MPTSFWMVLPIIIVAGMATALQAPINAALGRTMGDTIAAASISFGVGFLVLLTLTVITGGTGSFLRLPEVTWWQLAGGALGAFYVWAILWGVPSMGVVTMIAGLILGQMIVAILIDTLGLFNLPTIELSLPRITAVILVSAGLVLSRF